MRRAFAAIFVLIFSFLAAPAFGWGDLSHRALVRGAIAVLPREMGPFFLVNMNFVAEHSTDPDYIPDRTPEQRAEHFLDIDAFGQPPFGELPHDLAQAEKKFGQETMTQNGYLPWAIDREYNRLVSALRAKDWDEARLAAAHLSHFAADAHMPLHATENYDGKLTGNDGIHGRLEYELAPRYHGGTYVASDAPGLITNPREWAFQTIAQSWKSVVPIMAADTAAREAAPLDSERYYAELNKGSGPVVEERLQAAATAICSLFYSAWVKAGKPAMPPAEVTLVIVDSGTAEYWSGTPAISAGTDAARQMHPFDAIGVVGLSAPKRLWENSVSFVPAKDYAENPVVTPGGSLDYALRAAPEFFKSFPDCPRCLILAVDEDALKPLQVEIDRMKETGVQVKRMRVPTSAAPRR